jgi:hypothetical protein
VAEIAGFIFLICHPLDFAKSECRNHRNEHPVINATNLFKV